MRLSKESEYAILALIDLSERPSEELTKISDISERKNIPKKYLEQILLSLKNAGYLESRRGPNGGYSLAKLPDEINLAEIIRLMDGALAPISSVSKFFYEETPLSQSDSMIKMMKEIRDFISEKMENTSFSDLCRNS